MPRPGPDDNAYWPEADAVGAHWVDAPGAIFDGWVVLNRLPPEPFLFDRSIDTPWPREVYGPPGVVWQFNLSEITERLIGIDPSGARWVLSAVLRKLGKLPGFATPYFWIIPNTQQQVGPHMRWLQTSLIGTIGDRETFAHVLNWRHATVEDAPVSVAELRDFAAVVRDKWAQAWSAPNAGGSLLKEQFLPTIKYTEVRSALLSQVGPGPWVEYGPGASQIQHPGADTVWEIPTQVTAFNPPLEGAGQGSQQPYQVSMCVTHNSNFRGPRFRGRTYLPPMVTTTVNAAGTYQPGIAASCGQAFGGFLEAVATATDFELHVVSKKFATSARVIGTRVGLVPDTQRRRRRNLLELPIQAHGNPVGTQ